MERFDCGLRIADFGKEQLKSDEIHNKIPQSAIPNPQSNRSNTPGGFCMAGAIDFNNVH
jgi:hypothetical protein